MAEVHGFFVTEPGLWSPRFVEHPAGPIGLDALRESIRHGWIEIAYTDDIIMAWCDEDGLRKELPLNDLASHLCGKRLVGNVVFTRKASRDEDVAETYTYVKEYGENILKAKEERA